MLNQATGESSSGLSSCADSRWNETMAGTSSTLAGRIVRISPRHSSSLIWFISNLWVRLVAQAARAMKRLV